MLASDIRLGKLPARVDPRTLKMAKYFAAAPPKAPDSLDNGSKVPSWGMLANDSLGDCTVAGLLHAIMLWESLACGIAPAFSDADAVALYSQLCGYVPGNPATDEGGVEIDILNAWRKAPIQGVELQAYVSVDPTDWAEVQLATWLFGTLYMGLALPLSAQADIGKVWNDLSDEPGTWGGHCTVSCGYSNLAGFGCAPVLDAVTWGTTQRMTPAWLAKYCDELYAPLTAKWIEANGDAPSGFDLAQLTADLALV